MKKILYLLCILGCFASCIPSHKEAKQLEEFYAVFNPEQKEAFELAVESFERFLELNYSEKKSSEEQLTAFLNEVTDSAKYTKWQFNLQEAETLLKRYETSGLRKEIWMYAFEFDENPFEEHFIPPGSEVINPDSLIDFVYYGRYMRALLNIRFPDSLIINYTDALDAAGLMTDHTVASGLLYGMNLHSYNPEILKRILVAEFYFDLLQMHVRN